LDSSREQLAAARARLARHAAASPGAQGAEAAARVELLAADAHATGLPGGEADLVAVAQALHWLDVPAFAREAARLLRPTGSLAAWTYGLAVVASVAGGGGGGGEGARPSTPREGEGEGERAGLPPPPPLSAGAGAAEAADAALRRTYESLAVFWDARRLHVDDGYARLVPLLSGGAGGGGGEGGGAGGEGGEGEGAPPPPPPPFFGRVETRTLEMRAWRGVDELVGYVASWSGVERKREAGRGRRAAAAAAAAEARQARRQARAQGREDEEEEGQEDEQDGKEQEEDEEEEDPVALFRRELLAALDGAEDASLELVTPVTLVLASEPLRAAGGTTAA